MQKQRLIELAIFLCGGILLALVGITPPQTAAHGTEITYTVQATVDIEAYFDTGEPMANAQVTVYAPNDPANAWLQGEADENGRFTFTPDPEIPGRWDVAIRTAGHGEMLNIPLTDEATGSFALGAGSGGSGGQTLAQRVLIGAAVLWGCIGTALYFRRPKKEDTQHAHT